MGFLGDFFRRHSAAASRDGLFGLVWCLLIVGNTDRFRKK
jgi:hypothetical protein